MPPTITSPIQTTLLFPSLQLMHAFKHEIVCSEFYVERDAITFVGFFSQDQIKLATTKYSAVATAVKGLE